MENSNSAMGKVFKGNHRYILLTGQLQKEILTSVYSVVWGEEKQNGTTRHRSRLAEVEEAWQWRYDPWY